jgi:hypothetical protein
MNWQTITLLAAMMLFVAACGAPAPTMTGSVDAGKQAFTAPDEAIDVGLPIVTTYKSATCGCCSEWVKHMEDAGFSVEAHDVDDLAAVKQEQQVPGELQSCHTAIVDGYVIEGHVPAEYISRLLAERPDVTGLAVPGMPIGSPGMEMEGYAAQPFDVVAFDADGNISVFASHNE